MRRRQSMAKKGKKKTASNKRSVIDKTRILIVAHDAFSTGLRSVANRNELVMLAPLKGWHRLDVNMQHQQHTEWCWAAVGASVSLYYKPSSTWTQCSIAT